MHTCQNESCKKTFQTPLKALNLQEAHIEPYNACPFCLTKLNGKPHEAKIPKIIHTLTQEEAKQIVIPEKIVTCQFHLGYLSERTQKEQVPDECLMCKKMVDCMLQKIGK